MPFFVPAIVALAAVPARADDVHVSVGGALTLLQGSHTVEGESQSLRVPLPLVEVGAERDRTSVRAEWWPGVGSLSSTLPTDLSVVFASVRQRVGARGVVGIGTTVYNQSTPYDRYAYTVAGSIGPPIAVSGFLTERSHVAGLRLEAGLLPDARSSIVFAWTPHLTGTVVDDQTRTEQYGGTPPQTRVSTFAEAVEHATQVDVVGTYRWGTWRHLRLSSGFRYVNFVGRADDGYRISVDHNSAFGLTLLSVQYRT